MGMSSTRGGINIPGNSASGSVDTVVVVVVYTQTGDPMTGFCER